MYFGYHLLSIFHIEKTDETILADVFTPMQKGKMTNSMKRSPIYSRYENGNYSGYEFDPQTDFIQFLEEARRHVAEGEPKATPQNPEEAGKQQLQGEKRHKKSWKTSLFSWLKTDKKNKPGSELSNAPTISKPKHGYVSGPIQRSRFDAIGRARRPVSGSLRSFFSSTKTVENEIPYECLQRLNNPHDLQCYGPVYLVK